ncbi:MAG: disulfide reductase, partial [Thermoproteota archaeon]
NMKPEEVELDVGAIIVATGFDLYDPTKAREYGYGRYPNVITNLEFERLVNAAGPTGGVVLRPSDGRPPRRVAFIQCVGSRNVSAREYCSRICCMATLKHAHQLKEKSPSTEVVVFYMDLRSFGKGYEEFYRRVQEEGVRFIRGRVSKVLENPDTHNLVVRCEDTLSGEIVEMEFDMVVLAAGLTPPSDAEHLQKALKISRSPDGFFLEAHPKLRPVETHVPGIYLCGTAQGPKDIPDTVAQASAAAAQASIPLSAGKVVVEPITAQVNEELCGGCRICESICAYGAIAVVETERGAKARVHEAICQGCGACSGACPSGAITMKHFTDTQILAQIRALTVGRW